MSEINWLVMIADLLAIVIMFVIFYIAELVKDSRKRKIQEQKNTKNYLKKY